MHVFARVHPLLLFVLLAAPTCALSQGEASEAERRKAAKQEQAKERKAQAAEEEAERRKAEEEAEAKRKESAGITDAAHPLEDERGFYLQLDAFWSESSGAERAVATVGDVQSAATTAEQLDSDADGLPDAFTLVNRRNLSLSYDSTVSPQIEIGWRTGSHGVVAARYLALGQDAQAEAAVVSSFPSSASGSTLTVGGIDNQGFENAAGSYAADPAAFDRPLGSPRQLADNRLHGAESVLASGTLDVTRFDLTYAKTALLRKRLELSYRIGLTIARIERAETVRFTWRSFSAPETADGQQSVETVSASSDAEGFGPVAGVVGRFRLGAKDRFALRLGVEAAGLRAKHDLGFRSTHVRSSATLPLPQPDTVYQDTTNDGAGDLISILEGDVAFEGRLGSRVRVALGYRTATWHDAVTNERYPNAANLAALEADLEDIRVSGPYLRVGVFF